MAFNFNLQKITDLREKLEKKAQRFLAKKINERVETETLINEVDEKIDNYESYFNDQLHGLVNSNNLKHLLDYRDSLRKKRNELIKIYQKKLKYENEARKEYIERKKEKDILEKLKKRRYENYKIELRRQQNKTMDEVASKMYVNKKRQG